MKNNKKILILLMICILILIIIADLITKYFTAGVDQELISGFIKIFYAENTGAAWSIFSGSQIALIIISIIAVVLILAYSICQKTSTSKLLYIAFGFILGGALGNLFDRLSFGYVRDFIKLEFINFPIFNVADSALTIGIVILCIYLIIAGVKESRKNGK